MKIINKTKTTKCEPGDVFKSGRIYYLVVLDTGNQIRFLSLSTYKLYSMESFRDNNDITKCEAEMTIFD